MAEALTKAGRYQIKRELGRGSMGVVYEGHDPVIGRTVAIKTMLPEGLSPQEFQEYKARFQREAMAAGILTHPNIITVYDFGEDNGLLYLAMEFLEAKSLEKIVQEQTVLPIETILPFYDQVCGALDHAHRNKVVHRDIKPANIMILDNGLVKVTDFGIAKMMGMGMTQAGQILGTPNYMSPEQVKGRQIDGRSDIFSLGVILYELVTGEKPFGGQNITTVIYKIINENPIPPRELDASIHAGLSMVISKALAKNVDERYQTCAELAEDLRNYKNLGGPAVGQGTMTLKVPVVDYAEPPTPLPAQTLPLQGRTPARAPATPQAPPPPPPPPAAAGVDETPIAPPLNIYMPPPPAPRQQSIPQIAWVLGALLVVAIFVGVAYFFVIRPQSNPGKLPEQSEVAKVAPETPASVPPATTPDTPPAAPIATPATSAAVTPPIAPPATPKTDVVPKPETHGRAAVGKVGQLVVNANIPGAKISIDGKDSGYVTPHTFSDIPLGAHNVGISMDGYDNVRQSVTIEGGQPGSVTGNLSMAAAPTAELDVVTVPAGAEIIIDGKSYGPSPARATLPPGNHTYTAKLPGAAPYDGAVKLESGGLTTKTIKFGQQVTTGIVEVRTIPPGATVLADGAPVSGQTPTSFRLSVGSHTLTLSLPGYRPIQQQVTVSESGTAPINITLTSQ